MRSNNNTIVTTTNMQGKALYDFGGVMLPIEVLFKERLDPSAKEGAPAEWFHGEIRFGKVDVYLNDTSVPDWGARYFANIKLGNETVSVSLDYVSNERKEECGRTTPSIPIRMAWAYARAARQILRRI